MDPRVEQVIVLIRQNYHRRVTLAEMAETAQLSRFRLGHLFKDETGTSPEKYLGNFRLRKAKELLESDFLTVKQVMNQVGIADPSFFSRAFKDAYGITPSKCRREAKQS